ncbi:hypothetical protein ABID56_001540 [Alkalibacillus flavidus]|uniref:DUF3221 domain-containing protein n=1 Tax=Alkalibacillus flavidus TaxID=546021 RepID=A0ABV2KXN7_9BACI
MSTKRKLIYLSLILIVSSIIFAEYVGLTNLSNDQLNSRGLAGAVVLDKEKDEDNNNYYIFIGLVDEPNPVKVQVKSENMWNLIEQHRTYTVLYKWTNNETPILDQIEINDEFANIYKDEIETLIKRNN